MIAQPSQSLTGEVSTTGASPALEQEISLLRSRLDDAVARIQHLEQRQAEEAFSRPPLFPLDSPVMDYARQLAAEIFPGTLTIEVAAAPDDHRAQWYVFFVVCDAEMNECLDRELKFGLRLHDAFPEEAGDIRLAVSSS